jgi:hypothetical protein
MSIPSSRNPENIEKFYNISMAYILKIPSQNEILRDGIG